MRIKIANLFGVVYILSVLKLPGCQGFCLRLLTNKLIGSALNSGSQKIVCSRGSRRRPSRVAATLAISTVNNDLIRDQKVGSEQNSLRFGPSGLTPIMVNICNFFISFLIRLIVGLAKFSANIIDSVEGKNSQQRNNALKSSIAAKVGQIIDGTANSKTVDQKTVTVIRETKLSETGVLEMVPTVSMRLAEVTDTALILTFIKELARFEEMEDSVVATASTLQGSLFPSDPSVKSNAEVVILEINGAPAGFSLYFYNFSTFLGKKGLYIEDLYVREEFRGKTYGKQLLKHICKNALKKNCGRVEWWCLDWNEQAVKFYLGLGAEAMSDWTVFRLDEERIRKISTDTSF